MEEHQGVLAEYRRRVASKIVGIVMAVLGLPLLGFGLFTLDSPETARTAVCAGMGALLLVGGVAAFVDSTLKTRRDERIRVLDDRIEVATSQGVERYAFSDLSALEGKVIVVQQSGERFHAYRLTFAGKHLEISAGDHQGVTEETGRLLAKLTGRSIAAWL